MALAAHLLKTENEHVEIHEIRGFVSDNLKGAMKEAQAVAKGTRCQQFLFSVSLNPPEREAVMVDAFERAIDRIEEMNGLSGQPRMIVFHEKEGRRHAHAVWSRIDADTMTARPLPFFKTKLQEISKSLYLEHGWQMPRGLMDSKERDPRNFSLAEWQQAKRMGRDPKALKAAIQECWAVSDTRASFAQALESRGLYLAKGDRRAHVAVTYEGEVLSIPRMIGVKTKDVTAKLGKSDDLRDVAATRVHIAETIVPRLGHLIAIANEARTKEMRSLNERRIAMRDQHASERQRMDDGQKARSALESRERSERLRSGALGLWDRITGQHGRVVKQNEAEAFQAFRRDRDQRGHLVAEQLKDRRALQRDILAVRHRHTARVTELYRDLSSQGAGHDLPRDNLRDSFRDAASAEGQAPRDQPRVSAGRDNRGRGADSKGKSRGPDLGL
jgi:hypothetical protein